ncbi:lactonase family protein [Verrucomicrobiales bacterium]|nr:lactonase family protein [Verrucomicrobiales bacterium]
MNPIIPTLSVLVSFATVAAAENLTFFIGTQKGGGIKSEGIYRSSIDLATGELAEPVLAAKVTSPNFLEISPDGKHLYSVARGSGAGEVISFDIAPGDGAITKTAALPNGKGPCHITVSPDGRSVLTADYGGGAALSFHVDEKGALEAVASEKEFTGSGPNPKRQKRPHCHSATVSPDGRFAYFADLGTDRIMTYALAGETSALTPADPPFAKLQPGAGPRHMAFAPDGKTAYVINELDSTMTVFTQDPESGALTEKQTITTLPEDFKESSKCAEVRVHPTGNFVYGSNRGFDSVVVYKVGAEDGKLSFVEHETEDIEWPRNFNLTPDGKWCLIANANGDNIRVFAIDAETGALSATPHKIAVGKPMCIRFLAL